MTRLHLWRHERSVLGWLTGVAVISLALAASSCRQAAEEPLTTEKSGLAPAGEQDATGADDAVARGANASRPTAGESEDDGFEASGPVLGSPAGEETAPGGGLSDDPFADPENPVRQVLGSKDKQQLFMLLRGLDEQAPKSQREADVQSHLITTAQVREAAADRLLELDLDEDERRLAIEAKLQGLRQSVMSTRNRDHLQRLTRYAAGLIDDADRAIAYLGRLALFEAHLAPLAFGEENVDVPALAEELRGLVADLKDRPEFFGSLASYAEMLALNLQAAEGAALYRDVAEAFRSSEDEQVASDARQMLDVAVMLELRPLVQRLFGGEEGTPVYDPALADELADRLIAMLQQPKPGPSAVGVVQQLAGPLEYTGHFDAARRTMEALGKTFSDHPSERLRDNVKKMVSATLNRLSLIGHPLQITGHTVEGETFDFNDYRGKVTLVDFWASWCGPCKDEVPNIKAVYAKFHDQGFEVIGVNLDDELADAERYLATAELPWTTVVGATPETRGFENPNAVKCGVTAIPFLLLLDQEGNVAALHTRGPRLEKEVAALLGDDAAPENVEPADEEAAEPIPADSEPANEDQGSRSFGRSSRRVFISTEETAEAENADADADDVEPAEEDELDLSDINPYGPRAGLSAEELINFIADMREKSEAIRRRPGFNAGMVIAAERVLAAADATDAMKETATLARLEFLHRGADNGDMDADDALKSLLEELKEDPRPKVADEVKLLRLEYAALASGDLDEEAICKLLADAEEILAGRTLTERRLRLASAIVATINRLEDGEQREKYFKTFGDIFAKSDDRTLARYGKQLAKEKK